MNLGRQHSVILLIVIVIFGYGCAKPGMRANDQGRAHGKGSNEICDWTSEVAGSGKVVKGTLKITQKAVKEKCDLIETDELYVGGAPTPPSALKKVLDIEPPNIEILTRGDSCRRCYPNTAGGMTCVQYPGNC